MAETVYYANAGSEPNGNVWSNDSNAWNGSTGNYATYDIPGGSGDDETNHLLASAWASLPSSGSISKVEVAIYSDIESSSYNRVLFRTVFSGSTEGDAYISNSSTSAGWYYNDITNDSEAPGTWTWSDIENLDLKVYGRNSNNSKARWVRVYCIAVRVTTASSSIGIDESEFNFVIAPPISGKNVDAQSVNISNNGDSGTTLTYTLTPSESWIILDSTAGSIAQGAGSDEISIDIDVSSISDFQTYNETITVAATGASNTPQTIDVIVSTQALAAEKLKCKYTYLYANPDIESDNFNDNSLDTGIWDDDELGGTGSNTETGQQLVQSVDSTSAYDFVTLSQGYTYPTTFSISGDFDVSVKVVDYDNEDAEHVIYVFNTSYDVSFGISEGDLKYVWDQGSSDGSTSIPSTPFWLRVKRTGNTVYLYYSTNGTSWNLSDSDTIIGDVGIFLLTSNYEGISNETTTTINYTNATDLMDRDNAW